MAQGLSHGNYVIDSKSFGSGKHKWKPPESERVFHNPENS
jgi:hypothetical protein